VLIKLTSQIATVVVLAAGQGKRMKSTLPKVMHPVAGRPMVLHVLDAALALEAQRIVVVLGHGHEQVRPLLPPDVVVAIQERQLGTGHAVLSAADHILPGPLVVLPGDTPLITGEALQAMVREHFDGQAAATVLTMELDDPTGYGRIVRDADGSLARIVEHRDATAEELALREVNSSMYVLPASQTLEILGGIRSDNAQQEVYLTDVIAELRARGQRVAACKVADPTLVLGVNSQEELAEVERFMTLRNQ
jgi:bifunctional UDP-N-acetylglucosamine pyrophosphorylase/glucosamine-1-phosphate N-acetyltransferase